ncbi:MAG: hypothetical protein H0T89_09810 [Deltaproteobacteria bacterium]|nr:hypothetical protein [Deltaproteobacteria bacterium]MDQ3301006.1 hypothetical protein [Myxococcota bacterium]
MPPLIAEMFREELLSHGFVPDGAVPPGVKSPRDAMILEPKQTSIDELLDFLEVMITRREKAYWSVADVGRESAESTYLDTDLVVKSIRAVLIRLCGSRR